MKHLCIILLTLICYLSSCRESRHNEQFKWTPIDDRFDSIAQILDHSRLEMKADNESEMIELRESFLASPNRKKLEGRMAFWEADHIYRIHHNSDSAAPIFYKALSLTDSSRYPYDYARIKMALPGLSNSSMFDNYLILRENKDVFEKYRDTAMIAMCEVGLGNIFESVGYTLTAIECYQRALRLFEESGFEYVIPRIKMNLALALYNNGCRKEADSLIRVVAVDSAIIDNLALKHMSMMNLYYLTGDTSCLKESYKISSHFPFLSHMSVNESVEIGKIYLEKNCIDSASLYIGDAFKFYDRLSDPEIKEKLLDAMIRLKSRLEEYSEITVLYEKLSCIRDSITNQKDDMLIISEETRNKIESLRHSEIKTESHHRLLMWILSLSGIIIILIAGCIFYNIRTRLLREKIDIEKRLVKTRESLAALKIHQDNTGSILEDVITEVEKLRNEPAQTGKTLQWLKNQISIHKAKSKEWNLILDSFQQIHPRFESRLLAAYPSLTKKQIEFAGFIALGMTSKQIAEVLNIDITSVNTGRYRLRTKMGLQKGDSLEDAIMKFVN